ncbi:GILT-like protein C02D5.2 isoform X2 [Cephus cinctus]|uniref:GILT-like protein C02D5.2 isoform X2 n=1 Tax=Cephus cinctus TaxID=211228 RepID=A0AAJ7BMC5_CEPCN|nr:GILT-like protein C02D5.2 isoform X2 [Cephus cinctus]
MGLGSFRYRLLVAFFVLLLLWQSIKLWSPSIQDSTIQEVKQAAEEVAGKGDTSKTQKVLVTVYYEALCPDSRSFVVKQLVPTFQTLPQNVLIELVPYGKAKTVKTDNGYEFECQHGPIECQANIIHACTINIIKDPSLQLQYISCMIQNNIKPVDIMQTCAEQMELDYQQIQECSDDAKGKNLLAMYGEMTHALKPGVSFIPTVTLDKNSDNQPAILKNLLHQVCLLLNSPPPGCI